MELGNRRNMMKLLAFMEQKKNEFYHSRCWLIRNKPKVAIVKFCILSDICLSGIDSNDIQLSYLNWIVYLIYQVKKKKYVFLDSLYDIYSGKQSLYDVKLK